MATFELQDKAGHKYRVDAPDEQQAVAAFKKMQERALSKTGVEAIDTVMQPIKSFANDATDWMMLGKQDEILAAPLAGVQSLFKGVPYKEAYKNELGRLEGERAALQTESPKASVAGKVVGAVTSPATKAAAAVVNKGATWLDRAVRALSLGAAEGAVAGAEGDTMGDRAEGAGFGAAAGAAIAPVAQVAGEFIGSQLSNAVNWIRGAGKQTLPKVTAGAVEDPVTASVMKTSGSQDVSRAEMESAARELWRRLEADGRDPAKVFAAIKAGQMDERTLASIGGENVKQMIDTAASMPGRAKEIIAGSRRAAEQGQSTEIMKSAEKGLGVKDDFLEFGDLLAAEKKAAAPFYEEAYKANQNMASPTIDRILKTPAGKKALGEAATMMQNDMELMGVPDAELNEIMKDVVALGKMADPETGVGVASGLKLRSLDYVKRALDDQYDVLARAGEKTKARIILDLKRSLVKELDALDVTARAGPNSLKPEGGAYERGRKTFSGPAAMEEAADLGRGILKDDWIGNAPKIAKMTLGELRALRVGARQAIDDFLGGISNKADKAARFANIDRYLERLRPAFETQQAFDAFKKSIMSQTAEFQAVQMAGKGSQTAPRIADTAMSADAMVDATRAGGGDLTVVMRGVRALLNRLGSSGEGQRAAEAALALTPAKNALPFMSAVKNNSDPRALGLLLMGGSSLPASEVRSLMQP